MTLNIQQAAEYLGYSVSGVRKLMQRYRHGQPGLQYSQLVRGGKILFRQEWLDGFLERNKVYPIEPQPKQRRIKVTAGKYW
jgi:hypothetical protein